MKDSPGEDSLHRRLAIGALTNWAAFAAVVAVSFFLTPYLIRRLTDPVYGVWAFVEAILAYFTLFDLGIAACVVRFTAAHNTRAEVDRLNRLLSTCLFAFLVIAVSAFLIGAAVLAPLLTGFTVPGMSQREVILFGLLMLANLAMTLPLSVFPAALDGLQRFTAKSVVRIAMLGVRTIGTIALVEETPSLLYLGVWLTVCNLMEHAFQAVLVYRALPALRISRRYVDRETWRTVRGYGLHALLAMIAGRFCTQFGLIWIGLAMGPIAVAFFAIGVRLIEFAKAFLRSAVNTLTPAISSLEAQGDWPAICRIFLRSTRIVLYLVIPMQFGLIMLGPAFLTTWLGSADYAESCGAVTAILAATLIPVTAQSPAARVLYGIGRLGTFVKLTAVEAVLNVVLTILLCGTWGLKGAAAGAAVPAVIVALLIMNHTRRVLAIPSREYLRKAWLGPLMAMIPLLGVWCLIPTMAPGWLNLLSAACAGIIPYVVTILCWEALPIRRRGLAARTSPLVRL